MSKFDVAALTWDEKPARVNIARSVAEEVKDLVPLERNFKILDFGCGTGLVSFFLADSVGAIVGVDSSKGMVDVFNKKAQKSQINAAAYQMDLMREDLKNRDFDLIVSSMTFHHIKDPVAILKKLNIYLKDNGYMAVADLLKEDGTFHEDNEGVEHFGFDIEEFEGYLRASGFADVHKKIIFKVEKEREGFNREYPVFLIIGKKLEGIR
ncbi:MAG: class I SAM-dependent methyltransferase [Hydrogenothermaceae bacterium]|nr:class I SAM-dependent methyltransferase [Hydrogenothermaceae bacterium]